MRGMLRSEVHGLLLSCLFPYGSNWPLTPPLIYHKFAGPSHYSAFLCAHYRLYAHQLDANPTRISKSAGNAPSTRRSVTNEGEGGEHSETRGKCWTRPGPSKPRQTVPKYQQSVALGCGMCNVDRVSSIREKQVKAHSQPQCKHLETETGMRASATATCHHNLAAVVEL